MKSIYKRPISEQLKGLQRLSNKIPKPRAVRLKQMEAILPKESSAMHKNVKPSDFMMWKMWRSCEYETRLSPLAGSFSRIRRATVLAFPDAALNSARTTDPRATNPYKIAIFSTGEQAPATKRTNRIQYSILNTTIETPVFTLIATTSACRS